VDLELGDFGAGYGVAGLGLGLGLPLPLYVFNSLYEDEDASRFEILVSSLVRHSQNSS